MVCRCTLFGVKQITPCLGYQQKLRRFPARQTARLEESVTEQNLKTFLKFLYHIGLIGQLSSAALYRQHHHTNPITITYEYQNAVNIELVNIILKGIQHLHNAKKSVEIRGKLCKHSCSRYRSAVILKNISGPQLVKDYHKIYGTRKFFTGTLDHDTGSHHVTQFLKAILPLAPVYVQVFQVVIFLRVSI